MELSEAQRRALTLLGDDPGNFITIDGWCPQWQHEAMTCLRDAGYVSEQWAEGDQYSAWLYRVTPAGRAALSQPVQPVEDAG